MRVKMLTLDAGPDGIRHPGQIVEVSDQEGKQLIAGKYAESAPAEEKKAEQAAPDEAGLKKLLGQAEGKVIKAIAKLTPESAEVAFGLESAGKKREKILAALQAQFDDGEDEDEE